MRYGARFTRGRNARVHSAFILTGKTNASLAPCALGGDRLAITACGRQMSAVVSVTANDRAVGECNLFCKAMWMRDAAAGKAARGSILGYVTE